MKRGFKLSLVVGLVGVMGFLLQPALCLGAEQPDHLGSSSPLFLASLEKSLTELSSARIALDGEVYDPQATDDEENSSPGAVIQLALDGCENPDPGAPVYFPTTIQTCAGSGGATCRGTATCAGSETCFGNITCGTTCAGSGGATCAGTVTCGEHTCSGRVCREMSPFR